MNLLLIMNTPPPYWGTTLMNRFLLNGLRENNIPFQHANLKGAENLSKLGTFNLKKMASVTQIVKQIVGQRKDYNYAYLVMSVDGFAFYRHCFFIILLKTMRKKIILHLRSKGFNEKKGIQKFLTGICFRNSYLIQHSVKNTWDIEQYTFKKVSYVPNGWPDYSTDYPQQSKHADRPVNFIFLSNLIETKGLFVLLEAINIIKNQNKQFKVHFVGAWQNSKTKEEFYNKIQAENIASFIGEVGPKYEQEKYTFLQNMDVLVFPTFYKYETWGNVVLEAMIFQKAVIATNEGAITDMIEDGVNGLIVNKRDANDLAKKMNMLIENQDLAKRMGAKGREKYLSGFTIDKFINNMLSTFNEIKHDS